ncbi:hypothetical protein [Marinobacter goseongensis]|uniref:hypothetical protein n=1 Tax=Marinobacter goseongensis TaxID=453838 RepID=UPI002002CA6D|nr:hypothetical protein [Marinobacter goseongensis]MCK7551632.1 hypothetical protein [Marinobacter goseongensis]
MKMIAVSVAVAMSVMGSASVYAQSVESSEAQLGGMMGLSFQKDARSNVAKILDEQASQPAVGGELSQAIYVKTLERVEETFSRPIPDSINESTRDDD